MDVVRSLLRVLLPPVERAGALIDQLRRLEHSDDTGTALIPLSQVVVLLEQSVRRRTAALICGWLDGRSGRNARGLAEHEAALKSVRHALGEAWDPMYQQGRSMTLMHVIDAACTELATINGSGL